MRMANMLARLKDLASLIKELDWECQTRDFKCDGCKYEGKCSKSDSLSYSLEDTIMGDRNG